jgi:hypothetical protein
MPLFACTATKVLLITQDGSSNARQMSPILPVGIQAAETLLAVSKLVAHAVLSVVSSTYFSVFILPVPNHIRREGIKTVKGTDVSFYRLSLID